MELLAALPERDRHQLFAKRFVVQKIEHDFNEGMLSPTYRGIFVASFSLAENDMYQWGWYGHSGYGVSIALNLSNSRPPHNLQSSLAIAPCLYAELDKASLLSLTIRDLFDKVCRLSQSVENPTWLAKAIAFFHASRYTHSGASSMDRMRKDVNGYIHLKLVHASANCLMNLLRLCSHCKDELFHQEKEWRVSLPALKTEIDKLVQYRGERKHIPYIETDLFQKRLPTVEIMLGPRCEEHRRVEAMVRKLGYTAPVTKSDIPLRDPENSKVESKLGLVGMNC